ncbi:hypothetical protein B0H10DRAFT_1969172 [Mycena sp. CBHHK59/15]|nr:hypothetical protein B0H10DRAFT_1969172 [Mycena sp. CBHHK59/15]
MSQKCLKNVSKILKFFSKNIGEKLEMLNQVTWLRYAIERHNLHSIANLLHASKLGQAHANPALSGDVNMCSKKHTSQVLLPTHKNGWAYILIYQNPIYDWYPWVSQKPETESSIASLELVVGGSGSNIGPNLNRTEPDAAFRFTVRGFAEPEHQVPTTAIAAKLHPYCRRKFSSTQFTAGLRGLVQRSGQSALNLNRTEPSQHYLELITKLYKPLARTFSVDSSTNNSVCELSLPPQRLCAYNQQRALRPNASAYLGDSAGGLVGSSSRCIVDGGFQHVRLDEGLSWDGYELRAGSLLGPPRARRALDSTLPLLIQIDPCHTARGAPVSAANMVVFGGT